MTHKPISESTAQLKLEDLSVEALANLLRAKVERLTAAPDGFAACVNDKPTSEATTGIAGRELTLSQCLEELKKLDLKLKPQHANRRDEVLWEVAKRLERRVSYTRSHAESFEQPARIRAWLPDGKLQKIAESLARECDRQPRFMNGLELEDALAAEGLPPRSEIAKFFRHYAHVMGAEAKRAEEKRAARAAWWGRFGSVQRKQPHAQRFAELVLEVSEYFDIPTGLDWVSDNSKEAKSKRTGPIVEFGAALAAICGVQAPSGAVYDRAKREIARRRRRLQESAKL
jgi:hypothetical protein